MKRKTRLAIVTSERDAYRTRVAELTAKIDTLTESVNHHSNRYTSMTTMLDQHLTPNGCFAPSWLGEEKAQAAAAIVLDAQDDGSIDDVAKAAFDACAAESEKWPALNAQIKANLAASQIALDAGAAIAEKNQAMLPAALAGIERRLQRQRVA